MISGFTTGRWSDTEAQGVGDGELLLFILWILYYQPQTEDNLHDKNVRQYVGYSIVKVHVKFTYKLIRCTSLQ